ncbi:uncharacterized protein [Palaemon carinicauda]|uniref:uncharacterized protein n=1 Tax=Palaemon carinicauda TaxID=392227 RepID=UPI0035B68343
MVSKVLSVLVLAFALCQATEVKKQTKNGDGRLFFVDNTNQSVTISTSTLTSLALVALAGIIFALVLTSLGVGKEGGADTATGYAALPAEYSGSGSSSYAVQRSLEEAEKKYR